MMNPARKPRQPSPNLRRIGLALVAGGVLGALFVQARATPGAGAEGVIVAEADFMGDFALYVQGGKLHDTYSFLGLKLDTLASSEKLPTGKVAVRYEFSAAELCKLGTGGWGRLFTNGNPVGENRLEHDVPLRFSSYSGMEIGQDNGDPVSPSYATQSPLPFSGKIDKVVCDFAPRTERGHTLMPSTYIECPSCGWEGKINNELVGRRLKCPKCQSSFTAEVGGTYDVVAPPPPESPAPRTPRAADPDRTEKAPPTAAPTQPPPGLEALLDRWAEE
jgi:hypothetical protein